MLNANGKQNRNASQLYHFTERLYKILNNILAGILETYNVY